MIIGIHNECVNNYILLRFCAIYEIFKVDYVFLFFYNYNFQCFWIINIKRYKR